MKQFFLTIIAVIALVFGFGGCKRCDCEPTPTPATEDIILLNTVYSPVEKTVARGTKVKWTNQDPYAHTVTSTTNLFDSGNMSQGQTFEYTFNTAGTFDYYCTYHASIMRGKIIVN